MVHHPPGLPLRGRLRFYGDVDVTIDNTFVTDVVRHRDVFFGNDDGETIACQLVACENAASVPTCLIAGLLKLGFCLPFRRSLLPLRQDEAFSIALLTLKSRGRFLIDKVGSFPLGINLEGPNPVREQMDGAERFTSPEENAACHFFRNSSSTTIDLCKCANANSDLLHIREQERDFRFERAEGDQSRPNQLLATVRRTVRFLE